MASRILYVDDGYAAGDNYVQTGITVDWKNKIIFVPKIAMTLVQSTPTEIYDLDTNEFRLTLKELEAELLDAGAGGMPFEDTHRHNTEVTVGGVTLARVIEIINGYTVTFEDGQYAVNLKGSNNNIGDVTNVNQVSVRSANSAGLVTSAAIEFGEYGGGVYVKPSSINVGTVYPTGTLRKPVNNLTDAKLIATSRGFNKLFILESMSIQDENFDEFSFSGLGPSVTEITLAANASLLRCTLSEAFYEGTLDGGSTLKNAHIGNITFFNGEIENCVLEGNIQLGGNVEAIIRDSESGVPGQLTPVIDYGGDGPPLAVRNYNGGLKLQNKTGNTFPATSVDINSGQVILDSTLTEGQITIRGVGKLTDNTIESSNVVIYNEILDPTQINKSLFNDAVDVDVTNGTTGTRYPTGTPIQPVKDLSNAAIIATRNNLTKYKISGVTSLDQDYYEWQFDGTGANATDIDLNSANVSACIFTLSTVRGTMNNNNGCELRNCTGTGIQNFYGEAVETAISGSWSFAAGSNDRFIRCSSGFTEPTFDLAGVGEVVVSQYNGNITLSNLDSISSEVIFDFASGAVTISDDCSAGNVILRGVGTWLNKATYAGTATVVDATINPTNIWSADLNSTFYAAGTAGNTLIQSTYPGGAVYVHTGIGSAGDEYPIGSATRPSNNMTDAITIAVSNNLRTFKLDGVFASGFSSNMTNFNFMGAAATRSVIVAGGTQDFSGSKFENLLMVGNFGPTQNAIYEDCIFQSSSGLSGNFKDCQFLGINLIESNATLSHEFVSCRTDPDGMNLGVGSGSPGTIDKLSIVDWLGDLSITDIASANGIVISMAGGNVTITNTVNSAPIELHGIGRWANEDTYLGNATVTNNLISPDAIWSETITGYATGTAGYALEQASDIANANLNISGLTSDQANTLNLINATTIASNITVNDIDGIVTTMNQNVTTVNGIVSNINTTVGTIESVVNTIDSNISSIIANGSLSNDQANMLMEIYAIWGLDPTKPLVVTDTSRTAGANITQTITSNTSDTTVQRV